MTKAQRESWAWEIVCASGHLVKQTKIENRNVYSMHGPAAEVLLEGAEYGAEKEDVAGTSEEAAAVGVRPPRPSNWESTSKNKQKSGSNMEECHVECRVMVGPSAAWGPI